MEYKNLTNSHNKLKYRERIDYRETLIEIESNNIYLEGCS